MGYGNNRAGEQKRANFQTAGGSIYKFRHPFLAGAIDVGSTGGDIDEIDFSRCMFLDDTFFEATPAQDSSKQVVMVDGSTVTVTNSMLNGIMRLRVTRTTFKVATGDLVAALQLVVASSDSVGGVVIRTKFVNGEAHTRLYYGVSVKSVPHDIDAGLNVPVYATELFYAGFIDFISGAAGINSKAIWAVGSTNGMQGEYVPYAVQQGSTTDEPVSTSNVLGLGALEDSLVDNNENTVDTEEALLSTYAQVRNRIVLPVA